MPAPARYLIVVQRGETDLYEHLRRRFHEIEFVEVLLDRRQAERRRRRGSVAGERRQADRRQPLTAREREHWVALGYRLVRHGASAFEPEAASDSA
jgi:hypothetical protein